MVPVITTIALARPARASSPEATRRRPAARCPRRNRREGTVLRMREPSRVGAFVRDARCQVFVRRSSPDRHTPGIWDLVGGDVAPGEDPERALAREVARQTGWTVRRVEARLGTRDWEVAGVRRQEWSYLVEVDGDLAAPRLSPGNHYAYAWVGRDNLDLVMAGHSDGDRRLRDLVAKATRLRLSERLRLEPIGPEHAEDLWRVHQDPAAAAWLGGRHSVGGAGGRAARRAPAGGGTGVDKWMAYERTTGELIGRGGLSWSEVDGRVGLEVGWTVRGDRWGCGYGTEIGRAALAFAFDELGAADVVACTERHNRRSRAVMERLGMRFVREVIGRAVSGRGANGRPAGRGVTGQGPAGWRDGLPERASFVLYAITRRAWTAQAGGPIPRQTPADRAGAPWTSQSAPM